MIVLFLLQALFALSFIIFKKSLLYAAPIYLVAARMILSGSLLVAWYYFFQRKIVWTRNITLLVCIAAIFNIYLTNVPEIIGLQYISASKANFIYNFSPFFTALFGYLFLNEKLNAKKSIALLLGFISFLIILFGDECSIKNLQSFFTIEAAEMLILLASIATIWGWIAIKKLVAEEKTTVAFANGTSMLIGGFISLFHSIYAESWHPLPVTNIPWMLLWVLAGAGVSCLMAYNLNAYYLKKHTATFMSLTTLISPLFTAIMGVFFLQERITLNFVLAFCLVAVATFLFFNEERHYSL